jgi:hypothetical protein
MSYIGSTPTTQSFIAGTDYFNGDGSTTAFTLSRSVVSTNDIQATVNNVVQQPNTAYTVSGTTITFTSAPSAGTSNIYVRYLSTTTQSITPSQNTVSYSTLNSDNQSKLGISFKNRIINGAMVIAQRGTSSLATNNITSFPVDRTYATSNSATNRFNVQQNAGSVTPPAGFTNYFGCTSVGAYSLTSGEQFILRHNIEGYNSADLAWGTANAKTVTLSFWAYSSLTGSFGGSLYNSDGSRSYPFSYTINSANTWTQIAITIPGDTTGTWGTTNGVGITIGFSVGAGSTFSAAANAWAAGYYVQPTGSVSVVGTSGATLYLTGLQFEVGTQATTFDYRSYGTELALCQRYYWQWSASTNSASYIQNIFGYTSTLSIGIVTMPIYMRANPTLVTTGVASNYKVVLGGSYSQSSSSVPSIDQSNPQAINMIYYSTSVPVGTPGIAGSSNTTATYLGFSAEL